MTPERQYAVSVVVGLAAFALCVVLRAHPSVVVAAPVVCTAAAYYTADHPDVLWARNERGWESGALAGVSTFGVLGALSSTDSYSMALLVFGLLWFGFANGVAYAREESTG